MSFTSFLAIKLLPRLLLSLFKSYLFFQFPFRLAVHIFLILTVFKLLVCAIFHLPFETLPLCGPFLLSLHPPQGLLVVVAVFVRAQSLLVAAVLAEDLPVLPLFK